MKTIVRRIAALLAASALGIGLAALNAPAASADDTGWEYVKPLSDTGWEY